MNGKGLAGYVITKSNRTIGFAAYVNYTLLANDPTLRKKSLVKRSERLPLRLTR